MKLKLENKKAIVAEVSHVAAQAMSAVVAEYRGLTVTQMTALRAKARASKVYLRVVRNTLASRALKGSSFECLTDSLKGPVLLAFAQEEPSASARLMRDFAKENDKLIVKALSLSGQLFSGNQIEQIAKLPTRQEALGLLVTVMQAPITKLARTMAEIPTKCVRVLSAVKTEKENT